MNSTCLISLCIITRNEEHCLAGCLSSVKALIDEIILVDTGSEDSTTTIAMNHGAYVFPFTWTDDFAAARNYAISQAQGQWILVLDADERLAPLTRDELLDFMEHSPAEGYYLKICSYLGQDKQAAQDHVVRLFKNKPAYRFTGAIHEQVAGSILSCHPKGGLAFSPFTIEHYGYLPAELTNKHKFNRNTALIYHSLAENPDDPFLHYSLGIEFLHNRNFEQAGQVMQKTLTLLNGDEGYVPQVLAVLLLAKLAQPGDQQAEWLFSGAIHTLPDNGDFYCLYGVWLMQRSRFEEATQVLECAVQKKRELVANGNLPALLGDVYFLAGNQERSIDYYLAAIAENPDGLYPLARLLAVATAAPTPQIWEHIYKKLAPASTLALFVQARGAKQFGLACASILLEIIQIGRIWDVTKLTTACSTYCQLLAAPPTKLPWPEEIVALLLLGAEELLLESRFFPLTKDAAVQQNLVNNATNQLRLIASVVSPLAPTNLLQFWEEVFIGEPCSNCQSN